MAMRRASIVMLFFFTAVPAYANNPPAPPLALGEILILPIMALLTALAGGYVVRRRLDETSRGARIMKILGKILGVVVAILVAAAFHLHFFVLLIFAGMALVRAVQLIAWSIEARRADYRPSYFEGVSSPRLATGGVFLAVVAIAFGGLAPAFVNVWSPPNGLRVAALQKFVALQMAGDTVPPEVALKRNEFEEQLVGGMSSDIQIMAKNIQSDPRVIVERRDAQHFTVFLLPVERRFPFFPYNYLMSAPSYRADESGTIRMTYVHERNAKCPPNAPIVFQIAKGDIESIRRGEVIPDFR